MQTTLPSRRVRRLDRRVAVAALVLSMPALAACGLGFNAQTDKPYQPAVGSNDRSHEVDVLGALVVSAKPGSGVLIATLVNKSTTRADKLTSVQGDGIQVASGVTPDIPVAGLANLADPSIGGIQVQGSKVKAGGYVRVRLIFQDADPVTIEVPVVTNAGPYAGLDGPTSTPNAIASRGSAGAFSSPSPSTSSSPSPSGSASSTASPAASPTN